MAGNNHNLHLPADILLTVSDNYWRSNSLRRHIVDHLRQMSLMDMDNNTVLNYAGHANDQAIRDRTLASMDLPERAYYKAKRNNVTYGVSRAVDGAFIRSEKKWLLNPPMDYNTFKWFCEHPTADNYQDLTTVVIELFPRADFSELPNDLTEWIASTRAFMTQRADYVRPSQLMNWIQLQPLDLKLYQDLSRLWKEIVPRLPPQINKVRVICKSPKAANMTMLPTNMRNGELDDIRKALDGIAGRVVQQEWLHPSTAISD